MQQAAVLCLFALCLCGVLCAPARALRVMVRPTMQGMRLGGAPRSPSLALASMNAGGGSTGGGGRLTLVRQGGASNVKSDMLRLALKLKNLLMGNGFTEGSSGSGGSQLFSREALAGLGLNAVLAYGFVSNVSYITCLILSWVSHGKLYGISPLAPGQRKNFLAIYGGFWVTNNILRPLRFSLSLVLTPFFNKLIDFVVLRTGFKRPTSTGIVVFLVNFCGTISYLVLGLLAATTLTGTPLLHVVSAAK